MNKELFYCISENTIPYRNLALEEYLMESVPQDTVVLYLWQNRHTVVAGRNQNPWRECRVEQLKADGGYFVRRLSGGGAVFHDLGNLNFTFLARDASYDVARQLEVILQAVRALGVEAQKSGRNDIIADGRKFSGNAFYKSGGSCYHHGTLMVNADLNMLSKYLNASPEKLKSNGVASVRARVVNLSGLAPDITVETLKKALLDAFEKVYGAVALPVDESKIDFKRIDELTEKFSSWEWNFGAKINFSKELSRRFAWGELQLQLAAKNGIVTEAAVFSDAINGELIAKVQPLLCGARFTKESLCDALEPLCKTAESDVEKEITADIKRLLQEDL
ncbi:MAG: lipoate--protein ligase [Hydrogenoanaerobacterium sp.]